MHEAAVTGLDVTLSVERYLVGIAAVAVVVGALAWGAYRMRRALLPDWSGPPARLAETVIALGALYVALYALGSIGGFHGAPVLIVLVALGVALGYSARWFARPSVATESSAPLPREQWIVFIAAGATALVAAQWAGHVGFVAGPPWAPRYWAEETAADFLQAHARLAGLTRGEKGRAGTRC